MISNFFEKKTSGVCCRIIDSGQEAFILRLFRQKNKVSDSQNSHLVQMCLRAYHLNAHHFSSCHPQNGLHSTCINFRFKFKLMPCLHSTTMTPCVHVHDDNVSARLRQGVQRQPAGVHGRLLSRRARHEEPLRAQALPLASLPGQCHRHHGEAPRESLCRVLWADDT